MKIYYSDIFSFPLPPEHRFPLMKYSLLRDRILKNGTVHPEDLIVPEPASDTQLLRVHSPEYIHRVVNGTLDPREIRRIGLPWSPALVQRSRYSVGGTIAAARAAHENGIGFNLAGGTHHAHRDWGSGFCVFNDVAVAARELQDWGTIENILILDCDVHQGDGTAAIFAGDDSVFTFSIHGERNFPFRKSASDLDIGLPDGADDQTYLVNLDNALSIVFDGTHAFDFAFYLAGADPYQRDTFGRLALTKPGLQERDRMVFDRCLDHRLPVAVVLAGGYASDLMDITDIHINTIHLALNFEQDWNVQT